MGVFQVTIHFRASLAAAVTTSRLVPCIVGYIPVLVFSDASVFVLQIHVRRPEYISCAPILGSLIATARSTVRIIVIVDHGIAIYNKPHQSPRLLVLVVF